jgi:hypothetical protein
LQALMQASADRVGHGFDGGEIGAECRNDAGEVPAKPRAPIAIAQVGFDLLCPASRELAVHILGQFREDLRTPQTRDDPIMRHASSPGRLP